MSAGWGSGQSRCPPAGQSARNASWAEQGDLPARAEACCSCCAHCWESPVLLQALVLPCGCWARVPVSEPRTPIPPSGSSGTRCPGRAEGGRAERVPCVRSPRSAWHCGLHCPSMPSVVVHRSGFEPRTLCHAWKSEGETEHGKGTCSCGRTGQERSGLEGEGRPGER